MTPSIDQTLHQFANLLPKLTLLQILTLLPNFRFPLKRVRLVNRGRLLLLRPGPVPLRTCICSNVETILSWTCHVYGPFEFRTSLGASILPISIRWSMLFLTQFWGHILDTFYVLLDLVIAAHVLLYSISFYIVKWFIYFSFHINKDIARLLMILMRPNNVLGPLVKQKYLSPNDYKNSFPSWALWEPFMCFNNI